MKYEDILKRMLDKVPNDVDKREGSIIYDALAPAAIELAQMYMQLDYFDMYSFADKATDNFLTLRCAERGVNRKPATYAIRKGIFNVDVPIESRFAIEDTTYRVIEKITDNEYKVRCEQIGTIGNIYTGSLLPIDNINNLEKALLTDIIIPGDDVEEDEELRKRYFETLESEAFGGNIIDYKNKVRELRGVGGVKVYPVWNGGGTVKLVIVDSSYNKPSTSLVDSVQTIIDPIENQGKGVGIAPIGHVVKVVGVEDIVVNISSTITLESGFVWEDVKTSIENTINKHFTELKTTWDSSENIVVRIAHIESKILALTGVLDIQNTRLNNDSTNLILGPDNIPKLGVVSNG